MSASLFGRLLVSYETEAQPNGLNCPICLMGRYVQRFDVKDTIARSFQLESLILAQNERWRQA